LEIGEALDVFGADDGAKKTETIKDNIDFSRDTFISKVKELG
jgi:hypothetical protein